MKKIIAVILATFIICTFAACKKGNQSEPLSTSSFESPSALPSKVISEPSSKSQSKSTESFVNDETSSKITQNNESHTTVLSTEITVPLKTEPENDGAVVTYISESPDNKYICRVAEKYGSDKANLIAFIKKNSSTPGATVLEFSGKKDSNGNLIATAEELKYVYEISDNGTNRRASKDGNNNDNYNKVAAKVAYSLGEKFLLPSIDEMREKRRYEDYFAD